MWVQLPPREFSTELPVKLAFGDEAFLRFPTSTFNQDAKSLLDEIKAMKLPSLTVRRLRVGVYASTGENFRTPLDRHMRRFVLERIKANPSIEG